MLHRNAEPFAADVQLHFRLFFCRVVDAHGVKHRSPAFVVNQTHLVQQPKRFAGLCNNAVFQHKRFGKMGFPGKLRCNAFPVRRMNQRKGAVVEVGFDFLCTIAEHIQKTVADKQEIIILL